MDNNSWLNEYIKALKIVSADRAIAVATLDHLFLYASEKYLQLTETDEDISGKRFIETNMPAQEYAEQFRKISEKVNQTGKTANFFLIYTSPTQKVKLCYLYRLSIITNPYTNNKVARLGEIQLVDISFIGQMVNLSNKILSPIQGNIVIKNAQGATISLTTREEEILFLLILGKSHKEIATALSRIYKKEIASTTISSIISRQLYPKLNAFSLPSLINSAINLKLIKQIPPSLLDLSEGIYLLSFSD